MKKHIMKIAISIFIIFNIASTNTTAQIIDDPLQGSTSGTKVGGSFTSEGYKPGSGTNHILYSISSQISNGYIEFEMKGFSPSGIPGENNDHAFLTMYDGRGIGNTPSWNAFRDNYFRWNFHWRQNAAYFKCVVNCAAPTSERLNSTYAVFNEDTDGDGDVDIDDRDWYDEPGGSSWSWNSSKWYKVKIEWKDKTFKVYIDGEKVWANHKAGLYDYSPKDFKIWLGSGVSKYDADNPNVVYRNFKLFNTGGSSDYLSVSPSSRSVSSEAGSTTFSVSSNVSWTVSDDASWLSVTPTSGSNDGTLTANFDENTTSSSRTGTITVTGGGNTEKVTVVQEGKTTSNYLTVSPSSRNVNSTAGTTTFSISSDISWTATDNVDWLSVSPTSGSGDATLTASYDENTTSSSRTATITVSGDGITRTVTVIQEGQAVDPVLTVTPANHNVNTNAGSVTFNIESNVSWDVRDNSDWLSKTPKSGSGNATLTANYEKNSSADSRTTTITITGGGITKTVTVIQEGAAASLSISPATQQVAAINDTTLLNISSNINWNITDDSPWLTLSATNGTGNDTVKAIFSKNTSSDSRTATITVSGNGITKTATIEQAGLQLFSITAESYPAEAANILGHGMYKKDSTVTLICIPNIGWKFDKWTKNSETVSTDSIHTFTVDSSSHFIAELSKLTKVDDFGEDIPNKYILFSNFPNPFNPTTTIRFALPKGEVVNLAVYSLLGQKVVQLLNEYKAKGYHSIEFNAKNLPSGTYIYQLKTSNFSETKKLVLLK